MFYHHLFSCHCVFLLTSYEPYSDLFYVGHYRIFSLLSLLLFYALTFRYVICGVKAGEGLGPLGDGHDLEGGADVFPHTADVTHQGDGSRPTPLQHGGQIGGCQCSCKEEE